jgi:hypothetical protein
VLHVRYELGFYISEDDTLHSHRRENLKSYIPKYFDIAKVSKHALTIYFHDIVQQSSDDLKVYFI